MGGSFQAVLPTSPPALQGEHKVKEAGREGSMGTAPSSACTHRCWWPWAVAVAQCSMVAVGTGGPWKCWWPLEVLVALGSRGCACCSPQAGSLSLGACFLCRNTGISWCSSCLRLQACALALLPSWQRTRVTSCAGM